MTNKPPDPINPSPDPQPQPTPCGPEPIAFKVSVPAEHVASAGGHENFVQKVRDALRTAGIDVAEVALLPLAVVVEGNQG